MLEMIAINYGIEPIFTVLWIGILVIMLILAITLLGGEGLILGIMFLFLGAILIAEGYRSIDFDNYQKLKISGITQKEYIEVQKKIRNSHQKAIQDLRYGSPQKRLEEIQKYLLSKDEN